MDSLVRPLPPRPLPPQLMSEEYAQYVWLPYVLTGDYAYWTSKETKALAEELGIIFIGFKEIHKLQAKKLASFNGRRCLGGLIYQ